LISALETILTEEADEETGQISLEEWKKVRRLIREYLEITDSPSELEPNQIAHFIYWNCEELSRSAAERWLRRLTVEEVARLYLGDVLALLQPGQYGQFNDEEID
jgi:hypothetical protein